jgi:disulfide bond formation protein DsbB
MGCRERPGAHLADHCLCAGNGGSAAMPALCQGPPGMAMTGNTHKAAFPNSPSANITAWTLIFVVWLVAAIATLGALFLGEVMHLPPCVLCWYQRLFMFPLVLILPIGLFPYDRQVIRYALSLAVPGWLFAVFHQLLVAGVVPESIKPCMQGVPCTEKVIEWFGFLTIPLLSLAAFSTIIALLLFTHFRGSK